MRAPNVAQIPAQHGFGHVEIIEQLRRIVPLWQGRLAEPSHVALPPMMVPACGGRGDEESVPREGTAYQGEGVAGLDGTGEVPDFRCYGPESPR